MPKLSNSTTVQLVASERDLDMTELALQQVSQRRLSAVPSPGQVRDLRRWEAQLRGEQGVIL